jgi:2-oxoglutarate dehydrogenase E2 component (dihydrolipoamide succinyltransferase)
MPAEIHVPELGESVADAAVGKWLRQEGDAVKAGEALVELETDKINFEVEAEQDGVLESITKGDGEAVGVGGVIGIIGEADGAAPEQPDEEPEEEQPPAEEATGEESNWRREVEDGAGRASPSVRKLAQEYEIDLAEVSGSGSGGRITRDDVERSIWEQSRSAPREEAPIEAQAPPEHTEPVSAGTGGHQPDTPGVDGRDGRGVLEERVRFSKRRQTIAKRLVEAQQTAAMLTTFNEVDMTSIMDLRRRRKDEFLERHGVRLGVISFFVKAVVGALKAFPQVNSELQGDELVLKKYYDIGVALSTGEGLVVPVVREADKKSFAEVEADVAELARRGRDGKLKLQDLQGGTFTITNGGVFGNLMSTPILNTPQVGILGMHRVQERPMVVEGEIVARPMMYLALSYDHRVIDGAEAVSFLARVRDLIQDPESLLLEG